MSAVSHQPMLVANTSPCGSFLYVIFLDRLKEEEWGVTTATLSGDVTMAADVSLIVVVSIFMLQVNLHGSLLDKSSSDSQSQDVEILLRKSKTLLDR